MIFLIINFLLITILFFRFKIYNRLVIDPLLVVLLFTFIYSFFPALYFFLELDNIGLNNLNLATKKGVFNLLNHTSFFYFILIFCKRKWFNLDIIFIKKLDFSSYRFSIFILVYGITLMVGYLYPWPSFGVEFEFGHSVSAFLKYALLISYIENYLRSKFLARIILFLFMGFFVFIEQSRTFLFLIIFSTICLNNLNFKNLYKFIIPTTTFIFILVFVTLTRSDIPVTIEGLLWVISVETIFSTYSSLQAIDFVSSIKNIYVWEDIFFIPIYSFTDQLFNISDLYTSFSPYNLTSFYDYEELYGDKIAPMGGHFFLSEHLFKFLYLFPFTFIIQIIIFYKLLNKTKNILLKVSFLSLGFMMVKSPLIVILKTLIAIFIIYNIYKIILKVRIYEKKDINYS